MRERYKFGNINVDVEIKNYKKSDILRSIDKVKKKMVQCNQS